VDQHNIIPLMGKLTCHTARIVGQSKGMLIEGNRYYLMHFWACKQFDKPAGRCYCVGVCSYRVTVKTVSGWDGRVIFGHIVGIFAGGRKTYL